jgi:hypothetical protein
MDWCNYALLSWFPPSIFARVITCNNVITLLFVQVITFDLRNPGDGTCEQLDTAHACLANPSSFNPNESK